MTLRIPIPKKTFSNGEVGKALRFATDLAHNQKGVELARNFVVRVQRGLVRAPGTRFVAALKNEAQQALLIPFRRDAGDSLMLIFNGGVMRAAFNDAFVMAGAAPYELAIPYAEATLDQIRTAGVGDVVWIACPGQPPRELRRLANDNWTIGLYLPIGGPLGPQNLDRSRTIRSSGTTGIVTLTASTDIFAPGDVNTVWRIDENDLSIVPAWRAAENLSAGVLRRWQGRVYQVVSAVADGGVNPPVHDDGDWLAGAGNATWRFLSTSAGFVRITDYITPTVVKAQVLQTLPAPVVWTGSYRWFPSAWSDARGWPTDVATLPDTSLCWARGDEYWKSIPGDFYNFEVTTTDLTGLAGRLVSTRMGVQDVRFIIGTNPMLIGTADTEWLVRGSGATDALTPLNVRHLPETNEGAYPARACIVDGGAAFIGRGGRRAHYVKYDRLAEGARTDETTIANPDILAPGARDIDYQRTPHRLLWHRLADGSLRAQTFRPDEEVLGWTRIEAAAGGVIEQIGCIASADGAHDEMWRVVRRVIDGATRRYLEVMQPFFAPRDPAAPTAEGAWFVDCGLRYAGAPVANIAGANHLEGCEVAVFADGAEAGRRTILAGALDRPLDNPAGEIVVGLPNRGEIRTLSFETDTPRGPSETTVKRAPAWFVFVNDSAGGTLACNDHPDTSDIFLRPAEDLFGPAKLVTDKLIVPVDAPDGPLLTARIETSDCLPFELIGLTPDAELADP